MLYDTVRHDTIRYYSILYYAILYYTILYLNMHCLIHQGGGGGAAPAKAAVEEEEEEDLTGERVFRSRAVRPLRKQILDSAGNAFSFLLETHYYYYY